MVKVFSFSPCECPIKRHLITLACINLFLGLPINGQSIEAVDEVSLKADKISGNRSGTMSAEGDVQITYKEHIFYANFVTLEWIDGELQGFRARGSDTDPVGFETQPSKTDAHVVTRADNMEFKRADQKVVLKGNVEIERAMEFIHADRMEYDLNSEVIEATGIDRQVEIVFEPRLSDPVTHDN